MTATADAGAYPESTQGPAGRNECSTQKEEDSGYVDSSNRRLGWCHEFMVQGY